jgi:hypothetical protein
MPPASFTSCPDLRRHARLTASGAVTVAWTDSRGANCVARGKCLNISASGMSVELPDMVPAQAYVSLRCPPHKLNGSGSVRYCQRGKMSWVVGIEFSGGMEWRPAA